MDSLKVDLDNGCPIFYAGYTSDYKYGHAFVCDGYDNSNKFHFNWGWNGNSNGYYTLNSLNPSTHNYSTGQCAVFHIQPRNCWKDIIMHCNKTFVNGALCYYSASQVISNNNYDFVVNYGALVHLNANDILLTDGFYAAEGSDFEAVIAPCSGTPAQQSMIVESVPAPLPSGYDNMPRQDSSTTAISEPHAKQELKVRPNPVSGMLHIELPDSETGIVQITVWNLLGKVMLQKENPHAPELEVASLPSGMYLLQVQTTTGNGLTAKFVKE